MTKGRRRGLSGVKFRTWGMPIKRMIGARAIGGAALGLWRWGQLYWRVKLEKRDEPGDHEDRPYEAKGRFYEQDERRGEGPEGKSADGDGVGDRAGAGSGRRGGVWGEITSAGQCAGCDAELFDASDDGGAGDRAGGGVAFEVDSGRNTGE